MISYVVGRGTPPLWPSIGGLLFPRKGTDSKRYEAKTACDFGVEKDVI